MLKVSIRTDKRRKYLIIIPTFLVGTAIEIAFSNRLWKFIQHHAKDKTVDSLYTYMPDIKHSMKTLFRELKNTKLPEPLVDIQLKNGTSVKVVLS